ncbi:VanZ family protein [Streptomyces sp. 900105755]
MAGWKLSDKRSDRPVLVGAWTASVIGVLCLTLWSTGGTIGAANCAINFDVFEPFSTLQGQLNAAMFVPTGLLGVLVTRRVLPSVAVAAFLSAFIETTQGALPSIGRACDTSDFITNTAGALLGALCGWLAIKAASRRLSAWTFDAKPTAVTGIAGVLVLGTVWAACIQPRTVDETDAVRSATDKQKVSVTKAVADAFGDYFPVKSVQYASSPESKTGTVIANLPSGFLQMSWPDRADITASLDMSDTGAESGFPVHGVTTKPATAQQAREIATIYARQHYPWGVPHSRVQVSAVGDNATLGWLVGYRRYVNGVLMPMRLDVQVDRAGRISQLSAHEASDVAIAKTSVTKKEAEAAALKEMSACKKATVGELLAVRGDGAWHAVWRVVVACDDASTVVNVNAHTGAIDSKETFAKQPRRVPHDGKL